MEWVKFAIPLIALAVYLIAHVLSDYQEAQRRELEKLKRRPPPPPLPDESRPSLDERLAEARRRRESPMPPVVIVKPRPVVQVPCPEPPRRPPEQPRPEPPRLAPKEAPPAVQTPPVKPSAAASPSPTPAQQLLTLLADRRSLATAVLLREVLGPPVSRRR